MFVSYPAIFYKDREDEGYFIIFPDFDGGATQGENEKDALYMAQDWLGCALYDYFVEKREFPKSSSIKNIKLSTDESEYADLDNSFISLVGLDIAEYVKKVDKKSVKKTLTIPSYLNEMGKSLNINFSQILTDALKAEFDID